MAGGEREKYGEVGRLPRTKCRRSIRHRWKTVVVSDSASRIRQNASMEIDRGGAISHENCKFEYFCHYTPDSITTRSIIYILEREGKKIIFLPSLLLLLCRIDLHNFFLSLRRYRPRNKINSRHNLNSGNNIKLRVEFHIRKYWNWKLIGLIVKFCLVDAQNRLKIGEDTTLCSKYKSSDKWQDQDIRSGFWEKVAKMYKFPERISIHVAYELHEHEYNGNRFIVERSRSLEKKEK